MDKKTQESVSLLRERVQRLKRILAGVKVQKDERSLCAAESEMLTHGELA